MSLTRTHKRDLRATQLVQQLNLTRTYSSYLPNGRGLAPETIST